jgi:thioredoxin-dependent peroxiredoxin
MTSAHEVAIVLKEGDVAPKFKLATHSAGEISLDQFIGKKNVILAFYPKDDTPGCTKEMCAFSDDLSKFHEADTQVLGISCDDVKSHEKFSSKFSLNQPLLADHDGHIGKQYGTVVEGKATANRKLFVIDKKGIIRHIHEGMPTNETLLNFVKSL